MLAQILPPLPALSSTLMHIMVLELDGCETHVPPAWSPMLVLYLRGGCSLLGAEGEQRLPRLFVSGAVMAARHCRYDPGTVALTVMLQPGVIDGALGVSAPDIAGRNLALATCVGPKAVAALLATVDAADELPDRIDCFQQFLLATLRPVARSRVSATFVQARRKLFLPLVELSAQLGIGERTLERKVRQDFGVSLRDLRRIMRFGLTLQRLGEKRTEWGDLTRLAQEAGYYDQAHMHREFVEFSGLPPLQLLKKIASDDPAWWVYRIKPGDFDKLFLPGA